ncbi:TIGR03085 family metal-binding protein [Rugosimonospora acidiphila]|uniref:TIGR03085 family metal-binding protein n=1 Tax=Rugosimonospora acidiphila TaxID=556531 RepID=UPI0031EBBBD7
MAPPNYARIERESLCDLLADLGPDQPTLCTGWQTKDLAAHLIVRERRPDAAAGIMLRPLAGHLARVQAAVAARPFDQLVDEVRRPPRWSPLSSIDALDRAANTLEFFIHQEDVRRAQPDWQPRALPRPLSQALWKAIPGLGRRAVRGFPASVLVVAAGYGQVQTGAGQQLWLTGDPGELVMFLSGRQAASRAEVTGPEELAARLREAKLGI